MNGNLQSSEALGNAMLRAAEGLGVSLPGLAQLLLLSTRDAANPQVALTPGSVASSRALALVEVFVRANALVGNDPRQVRLWAASVNRTLGAAPCQLLTRPEGLESVLDYVRGAQTP